MTSETKSTREAKVGEKCFCVRCNGKGYGGWYVQMGVCFKCDGKGWFIKSAPKEFDEATIYKVEVEQGLATRIDCRDKKNADVPTTLWIGQEINGRKIVGKEYFKIDARSGKTIEEKKSAGYDKIDWV